MNITILHSTNTKLSHTVHILAVWQQLSHLFLFLSPPNNFSGKLIIQKYDRTQLSLLIYERAFFEQYDYPLVVSKEVEGLIDISAL